MTTPSRKKKKEVLIVCDGSSLGNGRDDTRAAAVAILGYKGVWRAVGRYLGRATNQQAEIAAATIGLESLREPCRVRLLSDSRYVVETMSGRFKRRANLDWWAKLDKAAAPHEVTWEWAKGHAGHVLQEAADKAARKLAARGRVEDKILDDAVESLGSIEPDSIENYQRGA